MTIGIIVFFSLLLQGYITFDLKENRFCNRCFWDPWRFLHKQRWAWYHIGSKTWNSKTLEENTGTESGNSGLGSLHLWGWGKLQIWSQPGYIVSCRARLRPYLKQTKSTVNPSRSPRLRWSQTLAEPTAVTLTHGCVVKVPSNHGFAYSLALPQLQQDKLFLHWTAVNTQTPFPTPPPQKSATNKYLWSSQLRMGHLLNSPNIGARGGREFGKNLRVR